VSVRKLEERAREEGPLIALAEWARQRGQPVPSTIAGNSMQATMPAGTEILIDLDDRHYSKGRVVAALSGSTVIAHRLIGRGRGPRARHYWLMRGDSLLIPDPPVHIDVLLGAVIVKKNDEVTEPPPMPRRSMTARLAAWTLAAMIALALEIDVRLARALTRALATARGRLQGGGERRS